MTAISDARRSAPALRNRSPIAEVLRTVLPATGLVLELASGTGEHVVHFARHFPHLDWQPSDPSPEARQSIAGWVAAEGLANVRAPIALDASLASWPVEQAAAIVCINMVHISPWEATDGLMRGAGRVLEHRGPLYLYGPFRRSDRLIEASNEAFDRDLRSRNPKWGLRELDAVSDCAARYGLELDGVVEMPANNLSVVFRKGM